MCRVSRGSSNLRCASCNESHTDPFAAPDGLRESAVFLISPPRFSKSPMSRSGMVLLSCSGAPSSRRMKTRPSLSGLLRAFKPLLFYCPRNRLCNLLFHNDPLHVSRHHSGAGFQRLVRSRELHDQRGEPARRVWLARNSADFAIEGRIRASVDCNSNRFAFSVFLLPLAGK